MSVVLGVVLSVVYLVGAAIVANAFYHMGRNHERAKWNAAHSHGFRVADDMDNGRTALSKIQKDAAYEALNAIVDHYNAWQKKIIGNIKPAA